ncbi:MAG TPA: hypothetical protein VEH29_02480 [Acidimicrobiales bacterium]|nr:hypothetical protein [Acidimicrobiales bacterium]
MSADLVTKAASFVAVAMVLAVFSGCSSSASPVTTTTAATTTSSSPPSSTGSTTSSLPIDLVGDTVLWKGTVSIQGAATDSETWAAGEDLSNLNTGAKLDCAQAASQTDASSYIGSSSPLWNIPEPDTGISMIPYGTTPVTVDVDTDVDNYKGPGTYTQAAGGGGGVSMGAADLKSGDFTYWIDPANGTTWKLVVNANGSGSFTFAKAWAGGDDATSGPSISGTVTWTCQNLS